jgi:hypothetical protein
MTIEVRYLNLKSISLSQESISLIVGDTYQLKAQGEYDGDVSLDITNECKWDSSDNNVTTVDDKGVVFAISVGVSDISAQLDGITSPKSKVSVTKPLYSSIIIESDKKEFNLYQQIELVLKGVKDNNETIVLKNDSAIWSSSDDRIIEVDANGTASAIKKGSATISAVLKNDANYTASIDLNVSKDEYVRLYRDDVEVEFPYVNADEYETSIPSQLPTFTIVAVGRDFTIENLLVTDLNGQILNNNVASFDGLLNGDTISKDKNITFNLKHDSTQELLHYFFNVDDEAKSVFSAKFLKK